MERGNHPIKDKKAEEKLNDFVTNETCFSYLIPIPKLRVEIILGTEVCPIYIV